MKKVHTSIDQLILDTKDLSYFPITRIVTEDGDKYWQVENKWDSCGKKVWFRTKFNAELAICYRIRKIMGE